MLRTLRLTYTQNQIFVNWILSMSRKYIGVDLGAWYGNKTRIATLEEKEDGGKLHLISIDSEAIDEPYERNKQLVECLKRKANDNAIIGIDAPFAIPYYLYNPIEDGHIIETLYCPNDDSLLNNQKELLNQMIYDNSARFVYHRTREKVLAPAGDKIGKMTARMIHMVNKYKDELNIIKTPHLDIQSKKLSTIEVYPRATLKMLLEGETDKDKKDILSYKGDKWKEDKKKNMIERLSKLINIPEELSNQIITDDDYDAIICALTAYLVSHKDYGYEKPDEENLHKFTNSFIYIPKNLKSLCFGEI